MSKFDYKKISFPSEGRQRDGETDAWQYSQ